MMKLRSVQTKQANKTFTPLTLALHKILTQVHYSEDKGLKVEAQSFGL